MFHILPQWRNISYLMVNDSGLTLYNSGNLQLCDEMCNFEIVHLNGTWTKMADPWGTRIAIISKHSSVSIHSNLQWHKSQDLWLTARTVKSYPICVYSSSKAFLIHQLLKAVLDEQERRENKKLAEWSFRTSAANENASTLDSKLFYEHKGCKWRHLWIR